MRTLERFDDWDFKNLFDQADAFHLSKDAQRRLEWLRYLVERGRKVEESSRHFGISPSTFRRWLKRFDPSDLRSLEERSRRPHSVRKSDVEQQVIDLIRRYRTKFPTMGKEKIRQKIKEEHQITISSSTVGRVIQRHRFFFADTITHREKRTILGGEKPDTENTSKEHDGENGGTPPPQQWGGIAAAIVGLLFVASSWIGHAEAADSASFQIVQDDLSGVTSVTQQSTSFTLNGEMPWYQAGDLRSTSFQIGRIVATPPPPPPSPPPAPSPPPPAPAGGGGRGAKRGKPEPKVSITGKKVLEEPPLKKAAPEKKVSRPSVKAKKRLQTLQERVAERRMKRLREKETIMEQKQQEKSVRLEKIQERRLQRNLKEQERYEHGRLQKNIKQSLRDRIFLPLTANIFATPGIGGLSLPLVAIAIGALILIHRKRGGRILAKSLRTRRIQWKKRCEVILSILGILLLTLGLVTTIFAMAVPQASAAETVPQRLRYNGNLLNSAGTALTSAHVIRFSIWKSADHVSGDTTGTGAINTGSSNFGSWQETFTVTPNTQGYFSVELGSITALPLLSSLPTSFYIQVEVKASGAGDTAYELLDVNSSDATIDRSRILPTPTAINADTIDHRDVGTGSGALPLLQSGGLIRTSQIPSGMTRDSFTIDSDSSATSSIQLQFGGTLAKILSFDIANDRFNFNDDVRIQGNLTVTGLINGVGSFQSSTGALKVASGGGLNVKVDQGNFRINGAITNFAGSGAASVKPNATNYIFFGSGGLTSRTMAFPIDESFIPLAQVVTSAGSVTSVTDRRVLQSDDREQTIEKIYHASFEHASYQGDATNNVGQLSVSTDNITLRNFYLWTSTLSSLQDYDINLRITLSPDFVRWGSGTGNALRLNYRSTSADTADNQLDISVFDTNGVPVTLSGSSLDLANTSLSTTNLEFTGSPTWTPGQDFLIRLKVHARNTFQMHIGSLRLQYVDLAPH